MREPSLCPVSFRQIQAYLIHFDLILRLLVLDLWKRSTDAEG